MSAVTQRGFIGRIVQRNMQSMAGEAPASRTKIIPNYNSARQNYNNTQSGNNPYAGFNYDFEATTDLNFDVPTSDKNEFFEQGRQERSDISLTESPSQNQDLEAAQAFDEDAVNNKLHGLNVTNEAGRALNAHLHEPRDGMGDGAVDEPWDDMGNALEGKHQAQSKIHGAEIQTDKISNDVNALDGRNKQVSNDNEVNESVGDTLTQNTSSFQITDSNVKKNPAGGFQGVDISTGNRELRLLKGGDVNPHKQGIKPAYTREPGDNQYKERSLNYTKVDKDAKHVHGVVEKQLHESSAEAKDSGSIAAEENPAGANNDLRDLLIHDVKQPAKEDVNQQGDSIKAIGENQLDDRENEDAGHRHEENGNRVSPRGSENAIKKEPAGSVLSSLDEQESSNKNLNGQVNHPETTTDAKGKGIEGSLELENRKPEGSKLPSRLNELKPADSQYIDTAFKNKIESLDKAERMAASQPVSSVVNVNIGKVIVKGIEKPAQHSAQQRRVVNKRRPSVSLKDYLKD